MAERLEGQDARQGKKGKPVLYVLIASLVLLAVAITGLMTWQGANSPKDYASKSQDASRSEVTGSVKGAGNGTSTPNAVNPAAPAPAQPSPSGNPK